MADKCKTCKGSGLVEDGPEFVENLPVGMSGKPCPDCHCKTCGGNPRGIPAKDGGWTTCPDCQKGEFVPDANVLKELNDKQAKEIQRLTKARKRLADAYRKLRDESLQAADRLEELEKALYDFVNLAALGMAIILLKDVANETEDENKAGTFEGTAIVLEGLQRQAKAALGEKP